MIANRRTANSSAIAATSHDSDNPTKNSHPNPTFQMVATQSSDFNPAFRTSSAETCFTRPPLGGAAVASSVSHDSPPPARSKRKRPERRDSHRKKTSASALEDVAKVATPDSPSRSREQIMSGGTSPLFTAHKFPPPYREKEQPSENRGETVFYEVLIFTIYYLCCLFFPSSPRH